MQKRATSYTILTLSNATMLHPMITSDVIKPTNQPRVTKKILLLQLQKPRVNKKQPNVLPITNQSPTLYINFSLSLSSFQPFGTICQSFIFTIYHFILHTTTLHVAFMVLYVLTSWNLVCGSYRRTTIKKPHSIHFFSTHKLNNKQVE